jgi:hypothetical protein
MNTNPTVNSRQDCRSVLENVDIQDPEDTGTEDEQGTDEEWTIIQRKKKNLVSGKKQRKVPNRTGSL